MTMVGAASGAGPIMRYSRSLSPMRRKPEGARALIFDSALAARQVDFPPPCGKGFGVGVSHAHRLLGPPSLTLPRIRLRPKAGFGGQERGGNDGTSGRA